MLRIVGLQRNDAADKEFLLLQNQGSMRLHLRGHVVLSEEAIDHGNLYSTAHAFGDDVQVPPGMYVLLVSGSGTPCWKKSKDGTLVYYAYMDRDRPVWSRTELPLHILSTQHSYVERGEPLLLR